MSQLSDQLWDSTEEIRRNILKATFVQGLKDGSLDAFKFANYVVQDTVFCYQVKKTLDTVVAHSFGDVRDFMKKENKFFQQYYERLMKDLSIQNPDGVYLNNACRAYIEFFTHIGQSYDPIYFLVALLPCMRLWPWLGEQLRQSQSKFGVYQSWADEYLAGDDFLRWEDMINKSTTIDKETAQKIYIESMKDELEFFNSVFIVQ